MPQNFSGTEFVNEVNPVGSEGVGKHSKFGTNERLGKTLTMRALPLRPMTILRAMEDLEGDKHGGVRAMIKFFPRLMQGMESKMETWDAGTGFGGGKKLVK